jgi:hypothetical protein
MAKILKESKIIIWDECTIAPHALEALDQHWKICAMTRDAWRRNEFIVLQFSPNIASHSKIDYCRWNKHLPQIINSLELWEETNWKQTWELHCWTIYLLKISPSSCWLSVMVVFVSTNQADWYHFLGIFAISFHRKMSSSTKCSRTSFITTKITNG